MWYANRGGRTYRILLRAVRTHTHEYHGKTAMYLKTLLTLRMVYRRKLPDLIRPVLSRHFLFTMRPIVTHMVETDHAVRAVTGIELPDETILILDSAREDDSGLHIPLYGESKERAREFVTDDPQVREVALDTSAEIPYVRVVAQNGSLILPIPADEINQVESFFYERASQQTV